jgi:hypothetical protein
LRNEADGIHRRCSTRTPGAIATQSSTGSPSRAT